MNTASNLLIQTKPLKPKPSTLWMFCESLNFFSWISNCVEDLCVMQSEKKAAQSGISVHGFRISGAACHGVGFVRLEQSSARSSIQSILASFKSVDVLLPE